MNNVIREIMRYQTERNLHKKEYNEINEGTNIVEELLESLGIVVEREQRVYLKKYFEDFVNRTLENKISYIPEREIPDYERVDAYGDIIVFAIGAIMKLGFDPEKVLDEVSKEINSREGTIIDGKFQKDLSDEARSKWYEADFSLARI